MKKLMIGLLALLILSVSCIGGRPTTNSPTRPETPDIKKTMLLYLSAEEITAHLEGNAHPEGAMVKYLNAPGFDFAEDKNGVERLNGEKVVPITVVIDNYHLLDESGDTKPSGKCLAYKFHMASYNVGEPENVALEKCEEGILEELESWTVTTRQIVLFLFKLKLVEFVKLWDDAIKESWGTGMGMYDD